MKKRFLAILSALTLLAATAYAEGENSIEIKIGSLSRVGGYVPDFV